jgi:adenylate cyclase
MMGDGAMIVADDVLDAFELARQLVDDAGRLPGRPAVRVGIHMGEAVERDGDYFGHAINVAARVAAESEPSQILVTEAVRDEMLRLGEGERLCDMGERTLRNVSGRMRLFCLVEANDKFFLDPVCRMRFPEDETAETRVHRGVDYRFCSLGCAETFTLDPGAHIE